MAKKTKFR